MRIRFVVAASSVQPKLCMPLEERDVSRLRDMLFWARKAVSILGLVSYDELMANEEKRLALVRCLASSTKQAMMCLLP